MRHWFADPNDKPDPPPRVTGPARYWKCEPCGVRWQGGIDDDRCWVCDRPGKPAGV